jgi:hypothetical protein
MLRSIRDPRPYLLIALLSVPARAALPTPEEIAAAEASAREAAQVEASVERIHVQPETPPQAKIDLVKETMRDFAGNEDALQLAIGNMHGWLNDPVVMRAAAQDQGLMDAIEKRIQSATDDGKLLSFSARQLSVIYGDLIHASDNDAREVKFIETLLASPDSRETALLILSSAWAEATHDTHSLDHFYKSKKVQAAFLEILNGNPSDPEVGRLMKFMESVRSEMALFEVTTHPFTTNAKLNAAYLRVHQVLEEERARHAETLAEKNEPHLMLRLSMECLKLAQRVGSAFSNKNPQKK